MGGWAGKAEYFFNTSYTCHWKSREQKNKQPVRLRLVVISKNQGTITLRRLLNCTPLLPKHIYVLFWLILNRSKKFLTPSGALWWWVRNRVCACWQVLLLYIVQISSGKFCVNLYVTQHSWKSSFPLKDNAAVTNSHFPSHLVHVTGKCGFCLHCYRNHVIQEKQWLICSLASMHLYRSAARDLIRIVKRCHYC